MVACDVSACWWNRTGFCTAKVTVLHNGICHKLVNRAGQQIPPDQWQHPWFGDEPKEVNLERIENNE